MTDPDNKASYFVERNLRRFPSQLIVESGELKVENENGNSDAKQLSTFNSQLSTPKIEVIGIPSGIGQAKQVCSILNELCKED